MITAAQDTYLHSKAFCFSGRRLVMKINCPLLNLFLPSISRSSNIYRSAATESIGSIQYQTRALHFAAEEGDKSIKREIEIEIEIEI